MPAALLEWQQKGFNSGNKKGLAFQASPNLDTYA